MFRFLIIGTILASASWGGNCGGGTPCVCADTVTSNYTVPSALVCPYAQDGANVLTVATGVTLNTNGKRISGANAYPVGPYIDTGTLPTQDGTCILLLGTAIVNGGGSVDGCGIAIAIAGAGTVSGMTVTNAGRYGVTVNTGGTLTASTITGVMGFAVRILGNNATVSSNTITGNLGNINSNDGYAVYVVSGVTGASVTGNTISNNSDAAFGTNGASYSGTNSFTSNTITASKGGTFGSSAQNIFPSGMDTTNTVDGSPVYIVSAASGTTYSSDMGVFVCTGCTGITVTGVTVKERIYLSGTTNFALTNVTIADTTAFHPAIHVTASSNGGTISGCTLSRIANVSGAIKITSSNSTTISGCTFSRATVGVTVASGTGTAITGNTFNQTLVQDISDAGTSTTINSNSFKYPTTYTGEMITWTDTTRLVSVSGTATFSFTMASGNGVTACPTCTYTVTTSPSETVSSSLAGSTVSGSFSPSRSGTYSLIVTVTDSSGNSEKKNFTYISGSTASATTRYYYRYGRSVNVSNGGGMDAQPLSLTAPSADEFAGWCSAWVQHSTADLPPYPFASFTGLTAANLQAQIVGGVGPYVSLARFTVYDATTDAGVTHSAATVTSKYVYATNSATVNGLNWMMDAPNSWYRLATKLTNANFPVALTASASPATTDLTYAYASVGTIYSVSNLDAVLLASTLNTASSTYTLSFDVLATGTDTVVMELAANRPYGVQIDSGSVTGTSADGSGLLSIGTGSMSAGAHTVTVTPWPSSTLSGTVATIGGVVIR